MSRFFKIIREKDMEDKKLRMPGLFVRSFGNKISDLAKLSVPDGQIWLIGITERKKDVWFHDGFSEFLEHYSIQEKHLLIFTYKGDSNFHVRIFNETACEIRYPSFIDNGTHDHDTEEADPAENLEDVEYVTISDDDESVKSSEDEDDGSETDDSSYDLEEDRKRKLGKKKASSLKRANRSCKKKAKGNDDDVVIVDIPGKEKGGTARTPGFKANQKWLTKKYPNYRPRNPSFMFLLREYNIARGSIPLGFAEESLDRNVTSIKVVNGDKKWPLKLFWKMTPNQDKVEAVYMQKGWANFRMENQLKAGDAFGFELMNKEPEVILRFTKVHSA